MSQWLNKEFTPHGVEVQVFPDHENGHGYFVQQIKINSFGRNIGGVIDVDPDFTLEDRRIIDRRDVAAFALRAAGVDAYDIAEIQDVSYKNAEARSRTACLALGVDRIAEAGLAQATAVAFRTGLFQAQPNTITLADSSRTLTDQFDYYRDHDPAIDLQRYMLDLHFSLAIKLSSRIERLWQQQGRNWFPEHLGVSSRTDLMIQWQLEQLRLSDIGHSAAQDQAGLATTTASKT